MPRRKRAPRDSGCGAALVSLILIVGLLSGQWWAGVVAIVLAAGLALAIWDSLLRHRRRPADRPADVAREWRLKGEDLEREGALELAADAYRRALALDPRAGVKQRLTALNRRLAEANRATNDLRRV